MDYVRFYQNDKMKSAIHLMNQVLQDAEIRCSISKLIEAKAGGLTKYRNRGWEPVHRKIIGKIGRSPKVKQIPSGQRIKIVRTIIRVIDGGHKEIDNFGFYASLHLRELVKEIEDARARCAVRNSMLEFPFKNGESDWPQTKISADERLKLVRIAIGIIDSGNKKIDDLEPHLSIDLEIIIKEIENLRARYSLKADNETNITKG